MEPRTTRRHVGTRGSDRSHGGRTLRSLELLGYTLFPARLSAPTPLLAKVKFLDLAWNSVPPIPSPNPAINHHGAGLPIEQRRERLLDDAAARPMQIPAHRGIKSPRSCQ